MSDVAYFRDKFKGDTGNTSSKVKTYDNIFLKYLYRSGSLLKNYDLSDINDCYGCGSKDQSSNRYMYNIEKNVPISQSEAEAVRKYVESQKNYYSS